MPSYSQEMCSMIPKWVPKTSETRICYKILFYMCTLFCILTYLCNQTRNFQCLRWQSLCFRLLHIPWGPSVPFPWYLTRSTLSPNNVVSDHSGQPSAETSWLDSDSPSLMFPFIDSYPALWLQILTYPCFIQGWAQYLFPLLYQIPVVLQL